MKHTFLRLGLVSILSIPLSVVVAACGGKVVFDSGATGSGGNGGAGGSSVTGVITTTATGTNVTGTNTGTTGPSTGFVSSTGPGPSTTTGGSCDCNVFCEIAKQCGVSGPNCQQFCPQLPAGILQCVCQVGPNCGALQMCIGGGPGSTTGSGTSQQCGECANNAAQNQCAATLDKCSNNPECVEVATCHQDCGFDPGCFNVCDGQHPTGAADYKALIGCAVCMSCGSQCQSQQVFNQYCLLPP